MDRFIGKRLDGRYEIQEIIGIGGMAVVYKAYDSIEDRTVAVKILKEEFVANEEFLRRFKNESKAIAVLSHPNIVKVYDVSFGDLIQYIVMEHIDGITLKEYIDQHGSLRWKDAVHFTLQILRGLQHAHDKGIVHRDVKPQNIMLLEDGTIKVTDFGIARFARSEHRTMTDKAIGSVHYISPEQARGEVTDDKADVYSVGVMIYEMLTGKLPFEAESAVSVAIMQLQTHPKLPREINGSIPLGLEQITMRAMQKDSAKRYQSAAEMLMDLENFKRDPAITFNYDYFIDDSPTKYMTGSLPKDLESAENDKNDDEEDEPKRAPIVPALAGIAVAFVLMLVVLAIFLFPYFTGSSPEMDCPNLIGLEYDSLKDNEEYKDLEITVISYENNDEYPVGQIFHQEPSPGRKIKKASTIKVKVSTGKVTKRVPDVYGLDLTMAVAELRNNGFTYTPVETEDEDVAKNTVIKTSPARGESAPEGSEITVYVSAGAKIVYREVPSVVSMNEAQAKERIIGAELTVGSVTPVASALPAGTVVSQSPDPAKTKQVAAGTAVNITVSTGVPPVVAPKEYTAKLEFDLPDDYVSDICRVSAWIDGEEKAFKRINLTELRTFSFELTSTEKTARITIMLDDQKYRDYDVDFEKNTEPFMAKQWSYPTKGNSGLGVD